MLQVYPLSNQWHQQDARLLYCLDATMHATLEALTMFGVGSSKLVGGGQEADSGEEGQSSPEGR